MDQEGLEDASILPNPDMQQGGAKEEERGERKMRMVMRLAWGALEGCRLGNKANENIPVVSLRVDIEVNYGGCLSWMTVSVSTRIHALEVYSSMQTNHFTHSLPDSTAHPILSHTVDSLTAQACRPDLMGFE